METIVKTNEASANAIINPYLNWAKGEPWYNANCGKDLYDNLGAPNAAGVIVKHLLEDQVLLPEQSYRCCYCMRRIANHTEDASIEHIIPQSVSSNTVINFYFSTRSRYLNAANVCLTQDYVRNGSVPPPYPHHVAYHNSSIACRKCNSNRSSKQIEPIFLYTGIKLEVDYNQFTGEVNWRNDPANAYTYVLPTLDKVGLNRPILKAIRSVWFYLKRNGLGPTSATRCELIYGAVGDSLVAKPNMNNDDFDAYLSLDTDEMWKLFLKYDYFGL